MFIEIMLILLNESCLMKPILNKAFSIFKQNEDQNPVKLHVEKDH